MLTPSEYAAYEACDPESRSSLFFRYWVCKESCVKQSGEGLKADPASYEIVFGSPIRAYRNGVLQPLALFEGDEIPGYRYAVCSGGELSGIQTRTVSLCALAEALCEH